MLTILGKAIKSVRELTDTEIKQVIGRYETGEACSKTSDGTLFLQQQRSAVTITPTRLTVKEVQELCEQKKIKFKDGYENRVKTYIASDESVDSYGDIIIQKGWDLRDRFKSNPAIMWGHDYGSPNIGAGIKAKVEKEPSPRLMIDVLFMDDEVYPFADTAFKMVDAGFLKGGSVGFIPTKILDISDEDERDELGLGKWGVVFEKQILLEFSVTPLGANKNALVQNSIFVDAAKKGVITNDELERVQKSDAGDDLKTQIDKALTTLKDKSIFVPAEQKKVIPYKKYPLQDEDTPWDAGKEVAAADTDDLKIMCTWYNSDEPDVKSSYKLPHHVQDGYATNWNAVANAMARLMQTNIPDSERKGVYNHLVKHYKDFDKEAPAFDDLKSLDDAMKRCGFKWSEMKEVGTRVSTIKKEVGELKEFIAGEIKELLRAIKDSETGVSGKKPDELNSDVYEGLFETVKSLNETLTKE